MAREQLCRQSLEHSWRLVTEAGLLQYGSAHRLQGLVVRETGREQITEALQDRQGVLLLTPHIGNWEFLCYVLGSLGFLALYDRPRQAALDTFLRRSRSRFGTRLKPISTAGIRDARRSLEAGGGVCLLPDQAPARGVHAPFFGQPALTQTLAWRLAERTRPRLVLGGALRTDAGSKSGFAMHYRHLPLAAEQLTAESFAQRLNAEVEALVREAPAQYHWEYKRFKHPPPGTPDLYA